jgi:AcrR family transcriptional regulator
MVSYLWYIAMAARKTRDRSAFSATRGREPRQRLSREERRRRLIDTAWQVVRDEGSDALTLGHIADRAGVTKPVVYDHFGTREGLLAALYREFDERQNLLIDAAIAASKDRLADKAGVIADTYVDCVLAQGRELPGVIAALAGAPELELLKREGESIIMDKYHAALARFSPTGTITPAGLRAILGAAEALSYAAASGEITAAQAKEELRAAIITTVQRQTAASAPKRRRS